MKDAKVARDIKPLMEYRNMAWKCWKCGFCRMSHPDEVFSHEPPGCNVLYMDGHVEFRAFGECFPATETVAHMWPIDAG